MPRPPSPSLYAVPDPEPEARLKRVLGLMAEGFADLLIADARAEVAERLGVDEASIDHEVDEADFGDLQASWAPKLEVA